MERLHLPNIANTGSTLRHRRVWVSPTIDPTDVPGNTDPVAVTHFMEWARHGRAFVGRARLGTDPSHGVPVGLALLPRMRLGICIPNACVDRIEMPLTLSEVLLGLPDHLRHGAETLAFEARARAMPLHVYGSVFWQQASGEPYLHDRSDLDLLALPTSATHASDWLDVMRRVEMSNGIRIDGEIELPCGAAVSWRELASGGERLLVKSDLGPALWPRERVWATWTAPQKTRC